MSVNQPGDIAYGFSQALVGVPNRPILAQRSPTTNDKAQIGTTWINQTANEVYVITSIVDNVATWVQTDSSSAFNQVDADTGSATPNMGVLNAFGGANINTSATGNTLTVNLNDNVDLPATNSAGTQGIYQIGGANFLFGYGPTNTFVGGNAGNTSLTALSSVRNVGVGNNAINSLTTGANNTAVGVDALTTVNTGTNNVAVGYLSLTALTTGESNIAIGNQSLQSLVTGEDNIAIGFAAGSALNGAQSSNIYLGNPGLVGDAHVMRLGTEGSGAGEILSTFIAGVYGSTSLSGNNNVVFVDDDGQLGVFDGEDGEIIIGATAGSPVWSTITAGNNINIINGPNSIEIESIVPQAIEELMGDNGDTASGQSVTVTGGDNITTAGDNLSTLTISVSGTTDHSLLVGNAAGSIASLGVATNGQLPIGSTGADPVLAALTAGTNINITNGAGSITIDCTVNPAIETLTGDNTQTASGANVNIVGGSNINTAGDNTDNMTINLDDNVSISGNYTSTGGRIILPISNSAVPRGTITCGTDQVIHFTSGAVDNANTFIGKNSGNGTNNSGFNVAVGNNTLPALTSGASNVAIGESCLTVMTTAQFNVGVGANVMNQNISGGNNTAVGANALSTLDTGTYNCCIGYNSGTAYSTNQSSNLTIMNGGDVTDNNVIRIGTQGTGNGQQNSCFIAGIGGVTPGGTPEFVIIDPATGELGSTASGGGGITTIDGDSGSATGATITFDIQSSGSKTSQFIGSGSTVLLQLGDLSDNCILGIASANLTLTGNSNTGLGAGVLAALTTGSNNTVMGLAAGGSIDAGDSNILIGRQCGDTITTGNSNVAIGYLAITQLIDGSNNIAIGDQAGSNWTGTESNNIALSHIGDIADSGVIRIGTNGTQVSCFIQGIAGVTVANSAAVLIDTTTGEMGTIASSRRYKENIQDMEQVSARILELRPVTFTYKNDTTREIHYGLIAEEVDQTLPELVTYNKEGDPETVRYHELPALLLNELQKQHAIIADLSRRLERLETRGTYESKA